MFSERPSQRKVMGVARRHLDRQEKAEKALQNFRRITTEEMNIGVLYGASYSLGFTAVSQLLGLPVHAMRESFLRHAREIDGFVPGEENINAYALRVSHARTDTYPLVRSSLQK